MKTKKVKINVRLRILRNRIDGSDGATIVAFSGRSFVGSVSLSHLNSKSASLTNLFVSLDYRGNGVARRLLDECAFLARQHSACKCVTLTVQPKNPARYLYPKAGFVLCYEYSDKTMMFSRQVK